MTQIVDKDSVEPNAELTTTPVPSDDKMVYDIIDTEHPENNATIDPTALVQNAPESIAARREEAFQRAAHRARIALAGKIAARREKENLRALKGRVTKRRKKNKLAKASRKRNRG